jgi:hypothetical protein
MGELLFWVGADKMLFGSDYGIWEPKWQIDGFIGRVYRLGLSDARSGMSGGMTRAAGASAAQAEAGTREPGVRRVGLSRR